MQHIEDGLDAVANGGVISANDNTGRKFVFVSGVIRNSGSPNYWQTLTTAGHDPVNVTSVTTSTSTITIDYSGIGATKLVTFVAVTDETLASNDFFLGSSVTNTQAVITLHQRRSVQGLAYYDGSAWQVSQGSNPSGGLSIGGYSSGKLTVNHDDIGTTSQQGLALTGRGGGPIPMVSNATGPTNTSIAIEFYDFTGAKVTTPDTTQKVYISRQMDGDVNPQTVDTTAYPNSNIWFYGVMEL